LQKFGKSEAGFESARRGDDAVLFSNAEPRTLLNTVQQTGGRTFGVQSLRLLAFSPECGRNPLKARGPAPEVLLSRLLENSDYTVFSQVSNEKLRC
jgi:hypothetical protein